MSSQPTDAATKTQQSKLNFKVVGVMLLLLGVLIQPVVLFVLRAADDGFGQAIEMMDYSPEAALQTLNENQAQTSEHPTQAVSEYDLHYDKVPTWVKPVVWTAFLLTLLALVLWRERRQRRNACEA